MRSVRASEYKKGIDPEQSRRRREDDGIKLRKSKREETMMKRRHKQPTNMNMITVPPPTRAIAEKLKSLPMYVKGVASNFMDKQVESVTQIRKLLSIEKNPPIEEVIESGVVPQLVEFLKADHNQTLQFEAAWALTNIASGTTQHTRHIIQYGSIGLFVLLLRSPSKDVREQAVWALGNIAGDSPEYRDLVLRNQALEPLVQLCCQNADISMLRNATWTLSNLCRGKQQPPFELVKPSLPTLANLIRMQDDAVLTDACWALSYLSDDTGPHNQKIQAVIEAGVCPRLVELLMHKSPNVKTPALRTVGNIVTGDDKQTQAILDCNALPALLALLSNPKKGLRKEACWTLSNITAGNPLQIRAVIEAGLVVPLITLLREGEFDIQKETAWAISNATSGGKEEQIKHFAELGVIGPLCDLLVCQDPKIIMVVMEGIENILRVGKQEAVENNSCNNGYANLVEECGGLDNLEALQRHENEEIYEKAVKIIQEYFDSEEDDDIALAPSHAQNSFLFSGANVSVPTNGFNF